jgi:nucleotide-binding universal stress UspA family protein
MSIVVGVSPTTGSPAALRWGAEEARLRNVPLRAVMAWRAPRPPAAPGGRPPVSAASTASDDYAGGAETQLREFVTAALGSDDGVDCLVVHGGEVNALLSAARGAHLLVVGEPRAGRLSSMVTSLTAPQVVHKADCPVVVMPSTAVVGGGAPVR